MLQLEWPRKNTKGTGSQDIIQSSKLVPLLVLKFLNAPLMRCRHRHFPRGLGENIWENKHLLEIYLLNFSAALVV